MKHIKLFEYFDPLKKNDIHNYYYGILDFIYDTDNQPTKRLNTYLHTTDKETCDKIIKEGFEFYEFCKTTDEISNNFDIFAYKLGLRKNYGEYTIIIQSLKPIVDGEKVTIKKPIYNEENEYFIYTLSPKHIKGYFNNVTGEITENPNFVLS